MRIGILHFNQKIRQRYNDSKVKHNPREIITGFKGVYFIAKEINDPHENNRIIAINPEEANENAKKKCDIILISVMGFHDILNLIKFLNEKPNVPTIAGGPACWNIRPFKHLIDAASFGRSEGIINGILNQSENTYTWYANADPNLKRKYRVRPPKYPTYSEAAVGCNKKCAFCRYGWTATPALSALGYTGSAPFNEPFFKEIQWKRNISKRIISGLDGLSENTRKKVNKPISNQDIINKITEIYNAPPGQYSIKLYIIIAFPWETKTSILQDLKELVKLLSACDKESKSKLGIFLHFTHFTPASLTPMELMPIKLEYLRPAISEKGWKFYVGKTIKIYGVPTSASLMQSLEMTICDRAVEHQIQEHPALLTKYFTTRKVNSRLEKIKTLLESPITKEISRKQIASNYLIRNFKPNQYLKVNPLL